MNLVVDLWDISIALFMVTAGTFVKMSGRVGCCECAKLPSTYDASLHSLDFPAWEQGNCMMLIPVPCKEPSAVVDGL